MRAFGTVPPSLRLLQQSKPIASCRVPTQFKLRVHTPRSIFVRNNINNNAHLRGFSTSRAAFQNLTPEATKASPEAEIIAGKLAAPSTTLPADLEIPEQSPEVSTFKYYLDVGKRYLSFYKSGAKNVFKNYKASQKVENRIRKEGQGTITELVDQGKITRGEFQFVVRARHDNLRVPLFGLMFLVCGEFTPFVVVFFSSIVPFNCRIPKQIQSDTTKLHKRRDASFSALPPPPSTDPLPTAAPTTNTSISSPAISSTTVPSILNLENLTLHQLMHVATTLNLAPSLASYIAPSIPHLLQHKVERRIEYLEVDDILIERFGGINELVKEGGRKELEWAAMERGIDTLNRSDEDLKKALTRWFEVRKEKGRVLPEMFFERR